MNAAQVMNQSDTTQKTQQATLLNVSEKYDSATQLRRLQADVLDEFWSTEGAAWPGSCAPKGAQ